MTEFTLLGTGTSTGVPVILCECATCTSPDPRDRRLRTSMLVRSRNTTVLVDTSPDLREQMLRSKPSRIDAVLFTHAHADHTAGLDELRRYNIVQEERLPVWATAQTASDLNTRFGYAFDHAFNFFGGKPDLDLNIMEPGQSVRIGDIDIIPVPINHGRLPIVGFRIGDVGYITDVKTIPEASLPLLADLDVLVLTALRHSEHPAHMNLSEALAAVELLQPRQSFLTHVAHDLGCHAEVAPTLPANVQLAVDGLVFESQVSDIYP